MKKALAIILALMLVLSMTVAACADDLHFEIVSKGFHHQYWQAVLKGAQQKADELGCTISISLIQVVLAKSSQYRSFALSVCKKNQHH